MFGAWRRGGPGGSISPLCWAGLCFLIHRLCFSGWSLPKRVKLGDCDSGLPNLSLCLSVSFPPGNPKPFHMFFIPWDALVCFSHQSISWSLWGSSKSGYLMIKQGFLVLLCLVVRMSWLAAPRLTGRAGLALNQTETGPQQSGRLWEISN